MSAWMRPQRATDMRGASILWGLSLGWALRQFGEVTLICDTPAREYLIDELGLPFSQVIVALDDGVVPPGLEHIWAAGKLKAYEVAARELGPFVHLDFDVALRKPLAPTFLGADLFVQSAENFGAPRYLTERGVCYPVPLIRELPYLPSLVRLATIGEKHRSYNFGIFGGNDLCTIEAYAAAARGTLFHESNRSRLQGFNGILASIFLEQYFLHPEAQARGVEVTCLLDPECRYEQARSLGYSHYLGGDKFRPENQRGYFNEVSREFPHLLPLLPPLPPLPLHADG